MVRKLEPGDEGKPLVTPCGDVVGVLERIDADTAYVCPDPGLLTGYGSWICGSLGNVQSFRLDERVVTEIDGDCVVIERDTTDRSRVQPVK